MRCSFPDLLLPHSSRLNRAFSKTPYQGHPAFKFSNLRAVGANCVRPHQRSNLLPLRYPLWAPCPVLWLVWQTILASIARARIFICNSIPALRASVVHQGAGEALAVLAVPPVPILTQADPPALFINGLLHHSAYLDPQALAGDDHLVQRVCHFPQLVKRPPGIDVSWHGHPSFPSACRASSSVLKTVFPNSDGSKL